MGKDVIVACDFSSAEEVYAFLDRFESRPYVKIGMELFYAEGPQIVRELKRRGHKVFLDLKLHDIPNTVEKAMRVLSGLEVDMCNVHAAGTVKMMEAALRGLTEGSSRNGADPGACGTMSAAGNRPLLIAVTQLTSTSQEQLEQDILITQPMEQVVASYAEHAKEAGLDGVVCSPLEAPAVHQRMGSGFLTVTPGVRLAGDAAGDQSRVTTPAKAKELGSDYIVVGRSITAAEDPVAAYEQCRKEFIE
ncbi:MAG: orotidine-5'-phosphate decarboxylase [Firmicutes bacterium]|nr:orotidine-5'-phosphate decarboxylase [Bacillota bacterium]